MDIEQLTIIIKEMHDKVAKAVHDASLKADRLEAFIGRVINRTSRKVKNMQQVFRETLMYSDTVYYQEEI